MVPGKVGTGLLPTPPPVTTPEQVVGAVVDGAGVVLGHHQGGTPVVPVLHVPGLQGGGHDRIGLGIP